MMTIAADTRTVFTGTPAVRDNQNSRGGAPGVGFVQLLVAAAAAAAPAATSAAAAAAAAAARYPGLLRGTAASSALLGRIFLARFRSGTRGCRTRHGLPLPHRALALARVFSRLLCTAGLRFTARLAARRLAALCKTGPVSKAKTAAVVMNVFIRYLLLNLIFLVVPQFSLTIVNAKPMAEVSRFS